MNRKKAKLLDDQRGKLSWLSAALLPWYREHRRSLPWRNTRDPYRIWLSEVILQQTRVDQGMAYWERFVKRYPTVGHLAKAHEDDVLKLWQGLGYYSRARNLLTAARQVMHEHGGSFPTTHAELLTLKGVGDYTAAAIASICFDRPDAVLDGNVYRVLSRAFGIDTPIDSSAGRKQFRALAQELIDPEQPGDHNQAMMELGATVCTPKNYACMLCPLQPKCIAFSTGRIDVLPVKEGVTKTRDRYFNYLHIAHPKASSPRSIGGVYMRQRGPKDIWQGLFELPLIEREKPVSKRQLLADLEGAHGPGWKVHSKGEELKHILSHQIIRAVFWDVEAPATFRAPSDWKLVKHKDLNAFAVPRLIERWIAETLA